MDIFTRLIEAIEGTEFYQKYIVNFPEPLNNVAFDLVLILIIIGIIVVPAVIEGIKTHAVRKRIKKRAEEYKVEMRAEKEKEAQEKKEEQERREQERKEDRAIRQEEIKTFQKLAENEEKKSAVAEGSMRPFRISTRSMEPALLMNTTVYAKPVLAADVKENDIVAYRFDTKQGPVYIIHRVIAMNEDGTYVCKGDNETKNDPPVKAEQIEYLIVKN